MSRCGRRWQQCPPRHRQPSAASTLQVQSLIAAVCCECRTQGTQLYLSQEFHGSQCLSFVCISALRQRRLCFSLRGSRILSAARLLVAHACLRCCCRRCWCRPCTGLLDDAYSLSHVRMLNISIFLNLVQALGSRARPELPPWDTALGWLQRMTDVLSTAGRSGF